MITVFTILACVAVAILADTCLDPDRSASIRAWNRRRIRRADRRRLELTDTLVAMIEAEQNAIGPKSLQGSKAVPPKPTPMLDQAIAEVLAAARERDSR